MIIRQKKGDNFSFERSSASARSLLDVRNAERELVEAEVKQIEARRDLAQGELRDSGFDGTAENDGAGKQLPRGSPAAATKLEPHAYYKEARHPGAFR